MTLIATRLSQVTLGQPQQCRNLTLFPLLAEGPAQPGYRLLDQALALGCARITEISEGGSVPQLRFINDGDLPVLLLDGEELIGAKQNRILNLSVLAPAHKTIVIPVSCVEAGRWHAQSSDFTGARRAHFATGRARKARDVSESLRRRGTRESDQDRVWADIAVKSTRFGIDSPTRAAAALYEGQRERLDDFQRAFTPQPGQCGNLFAIAGQVVGLDLFDSPATLASVLPKLVESHALDALDALDTLKGRNLTAGLDAASKAMDPAKAESWLAAIPQAVIERFPAVGEGEDWRLHGPQVTGGALVKEGQIIHLCAFHLAGDGKNDPGPGDGEDEDDDNLPGRGAYAPGGYHRRPSLQAAERQPVDLALAIDGSAAISPDAWTTTLAAVNLVSERLSARDRLAVVIYQDQARILLPPLAVDTRVRQELMAALTNLSPSGRAALGEGWLTACGLISEASGDGRRRHCLLIAAGSITVGLADATELAGHAATLHGLGVATSTFGLGDAHDASLLEALAAAGGGTYHHLANPAHLPRAVSQEVEAILSRATPDRGRGPDPSERQALICLPPLADMEHGANGQHWPKLSRDQRAALAKATMTALMSGTYANAAGQPVDWQDAVEQAIAAKRSLPPDAPLPAPGPRAQGLTRVQVTCESTLFAARRLTARHRRVLVLVFGNGIEPGGGFLQGNRGQESALCRASALYATLQGEAMYAAHQARPQPDSTDWAILSPDVPVFRDDAGQPLDQPWPLSFITAAAPYAPRLGREPSARLMESRIRRVLAIARANDYPALVLGAWGCGTYGNDPARIAALFRTALEEQAGAFAEVVFAVADGSPGRKTYGAFAAAFRPGS